MRRKVWHPLEDLPKHHGDECPPVNWWRERGCFCFIVDCKPLAQVLSGHAPLRVPSMTPLFERMASTLFDLLEAGLTPCEQSEDPVLWHRREFNKMADFAVNHTMDRKQGWNSTSIAPFAILPQWRQTMCATLMGAPEPIPALAQRGS